MTDPEIDEHSVYLIVHQERDGSLSGPVKVGFSKWPDKRLSSLQTGNPKKLVLLARFRTPSRALAAQAEEVFHTIGKKRGEGVGGEWFDMTPIDGLGSLIKCMVAIISEDVGWESQEAGLLTDWSGLPEAMKRYLELAGEPYV